jgi:hypothetical protein
MVKKLFPYLLVFFTTFFIYFAVGTHFTFKPKWFLDYFNLMAESVRRFHLDIQNSGATYDLVYFKEKWYAPWGPLPAFLLIPGQLLLGRFIPSFYLSIFFESLSTTIFYALLRRIREEFISHLSNFSIVMFTVLLAFGTTQFYVGTLGSAWHVDQMVSAFLATLGIYVVFKKKRKIKDYVISSVIFSLAFLGRPTVALMISLPFFLYLWEHFVERKTKQKKFSFFQAIKIFGVPIFLFGSLFFLYNYLRFGSLFEYGYSHIHESPYLAGIRKQTGTFSLSYLPYNLWYMLLEIPGISLKEGGLSFHFNLLGNSILFLTPPFLAVFLAPLRNPYIVLLWICSAITMLPSLIIYSTGWMQFGYRYSLDITVVLVLLTVFGMKGRINILFILGVFVSICFYLWGIFTLL